MVLCNPQKNIENETLYDQINLANAMVGEISNGKAFYKAIETNDPEKLNDELLKLEKPQKFNHTQYVATGTNKNIVRTALKGLSKENKFKTDVIELPQGSPYGNVTIDEKNCTLCLACVSACPAGALQDNPETPQLLFREDACIQCGIWLKPVLKK